YEELEDWEKNVYWHFDLGLRTEAGDVMPLRIPKPFEWGAVFGSVPEALAQVAIEQRGKRFGQRLRSVLEDVFLLRAVPTALLVPLELWANVNTFTDRPIVPESKQGLDPELQHGPHASLTAREMGKLLGVSPAKIDHAIRGFFGTLGLYAVVLADQGVRAAGD
ncbi:LPD38 domain-containing protein, partial [Pelomicrobium sp. G1]|uniref:LPD38 domain-containing protein n=1 Tax=Pelomicrobium sp. G1 TaxID=3452920 RepID=UPI003F7753CD